MRLIIWIFLLICVFISSSLIIDSDKEKGERKYFISDVFMLLPIESISNSLRLKLLKTHQIDSIDNEKYLTMDIDSLHNSIFIQSCFIESMTMPCDNYYIKSYQIDSSRFIIVYSSSSNSYADNYQNDLGIYQYDIETRKLLKDSTKRKAFNIQLKDFFESNTPKSIINKYSENVNPTYSFQDSVIFCSITDRGYGNTLNHERYLKGNVIKILWNGNDFKIDRIYKEK